MTILVGVSWLAGCVGGQDRDAPAAPILAKPVPSILELSLRGCYWLIAAFPLPPGAADRFMPVGFEPSLRDVLPIDPPVPFLGMGGFSCKTVAGDGLEVRDVDILWALILVEPPPKYRSPDVDVHAIMPALFVDDEAIGAVFQSWGLDNLTPGRVQVSLGALTPVNRGGSALASTDKTTVRLETSAFGSPRPANPLDWRIYATQVMAGTAPTVVAGFDFDEERAASYEFGGNGTASLEVSGDASLFPAQRLAGGGSHEWWGDAAVGVFRYTTDWMVPS